MIPIRLSPNWQPLKPKCRGIELTQRLDKWLVYARFVKHRSLASALIEGGHVRLNRVKVLKIGHALKEGDVLTLVLQGDIRVIKVLGLAEKRGPATAAMQLYQELTIEQKISA